MNKLLNCALLAIAISCGGNNGNTPVSTSAGTVVPVTGAEGIFSGTVNSAFGGPLTAYVASSAAGELRFVASNHDMAVAQLSTGSGTLYPGIAVGTFLTLSGITSTSGLSLSGQYTAGSGDSGSFNFIFNDVYNRPQTLADLAGSFSASGAVTTTGLAMNLTLDTTGNFTGSDGSGFTFSGTLSQPDNQKNLFTMTLSYGSGPHIGETYSGLAFWSDPSSGLVSSALYFQVSGVNNNFALGSILVRSL